MIDYHMIGSRIRRFRQKKGITQEELAFQIGTSASHISNLELGKKKPSLQKLKEIADIMNLTVNDFLYDYPDSKENVLDNTLIIPAELPEILSEYPREKGQRIIHYIIDIMQTIAEK